MRKAPDYIRNDKTYNTYFRKSEIDEIYASNNYDDEKTMKQLNEMCDELKIQKGDSYGSNQLRQEQRLCDTWL